MIEGGENEDEEGCVSTFENQFGFISECSIIEVIHLDKTLMEKYRKRKRNLHIVFIDLEKVYDKFSREVFWRCLESNGVTLA